MIFKCKNCGGNVIYSPDKKQMYCPHCEGLESQDPVPAVSITECANCGAPMNIGEYTSATKCDHCGSYIVFDQRVGGDFVPHLILPFKISKDQAAKRLKDEFGKRIFTPASFLSETTLQSMEGIYVPFWLYDFYAHVDFEGRGSKIKVWRVGNTEYTETSIYSVQRNMTVDFDKIPVDASKAMEDGIMDLMEPYEYAALEDFQEKYMSGFYSEFFNQSALELEFRAAEKAKKDSESLLRETISGYATVSTVNENINLERDVVKYALMPVWLYVFYYRGKTYKYHVNGQTGKIIGNTPVSFQKIIAYGLTLFASATTLALLLRTILEVL